MHTDDGGDLSAPWRAGCSARSAACVAVHSSASTAPSRRRSSASRRPSRDTSTWRKMAAMSRKAARLKRHGGVGYDGVAADPPPPLNRSLGWTQHGPSKDAIKKNHKKTYKNIYKKTQNPQNKKTANPQKNVFVFPPPPRPTRPPSPHGSAASNSRHLAPWHCYQDLSGFEDWKWGPRHIIRKTQKDSLPGR